LLTVPVDERSTEQIESLQKHQSLFLSIFIERLTIDSCTKDIPLDSFPKFISCMDNLKEVHLRYSMFLRVRLCWVDS
jgi:hypothetical protein